MQIWNLLSLEQVELGRRIRHARERIGLTQEALAESVERDQKAVSEYENGKRKLPAVDLPVYARALGVPVSYFFDGDIQTDQLDQLLLQEFHSLPTEEDKQAAIQAVHLISNTIKRHTSIP